MKVFLLSGKQGSGKTTTADALVKACADYGYEPYRTRYAKGLYDIHDAARDKAREIGVPYPDKFGPLLQLLGTELGRDVFGKDVWLKACIKNIVDNAHDNSCVIIDDCRFINEFHAFDNDDRFEVVKVRLQAEADIRKSRTTAWRDAVEHPSETELDEYVRAGNFTEVFHTTVGNYTTERIVSYLCNEYLKEPF